MGIQYAPTFEERYEECRANIRRLRDMIEFHESRGETEEIGDLWEDIADEEREMDAIREEQAVYNARVGYID